VLVSESSVFFQKVKVTDFLFDHQWTPLFDDKHFGILPLVSGTFLTSMIAIAFALPIGLSIAVYLNEYAPKSFPEND
jgi:phosphate transport system permease protein